MGQVKESGELGAVPTLVDLNLGPKKRRDHGTLHNGLNYGQFDAAQLRKQLAGLPVPRMFGTRIVLAVDVSP